MFTLNQKELLATLKEHNQFTKSKGGAKLALFDHVLVQVKNFNIKLISTNLDVEYTTTFPATYVEAEITFTIPKKQSIDFISKLNKKDSVTIKVTENNWIEISQGETKAQFMGISVEDFPLPNEDDFELEQIDALEWKQALKAVNYIKPDSFEKQAHKIGLCIKNYSINSTDGWRLSSAQIKPITNEKIGDGVLLMKDCAVKVEKMLNKVIPFAKFGYDGRHFVFSQLNKKIVVMALEGNFPNLTQLKNVFEKSMSICLNRESLLNKFGLMGAVNNESVFIDISRNQICLSATNVQSGEIKKCFEVDFDLNTELNVHLNTTYVIQALKSMDDETIEMKFQSDVMPVFFNGNVFNMVMTKKKD